MSSKFYITTTLPYVNAEPHIGFALEIVQADIIARHHRDVLKEGVFFNTGTDEHGLKIYQKAIELGKTPQVYVDEYAEKFRKLKDALNLMSDDLHFIRTTDDNHKKAVQEFWKRCEKNGDIYKSVYKMKYCVGCELEKTDSELADSKCPLHPNREIEIIEEENYFFRFSKYGPKLADFYAKSHNFVFPEVRFSEIKSFVEAGLRDFSISRLKGKMPWGIPVPGDDAHVIYVWFDALINYISTLGWPADEKNFVDFWGTKNRPNGIQIAGKDQIRQQAAMWQAMLMSAGLPNSKQILIHGFITSSGQKMSKSLGNVVNPYEVVEKYGRDALRYWLAREISTFDDGDFTWEKFRESYNANLADNLGNLTNRIMKMVISYNVPIISENFAKEISKKPSFLDNYDIHNEIDGIFKNLDSLNSDIEAKKPFKKIETKPEEAKEDIQIIVNNFYYNVVRLVPFLPATAEKILECIRERKMPETPLFPRK